MKGGAFEITLASPVPESGMEDFRPQIEEVCDRFVYWPEPVWQRIRPLSRLLFACSGLPIPVAMDRSRRGRRVVRREISNACDLALFDFPHATTLGWDGQRGVRAIFTHNVEAEIFERHANSSDGWRALVWRNQQRKMASLEATVLREADGVVAVSSRDADSFSARYGVGNVDVIQTGVDLDFFAFHGPADNQKIVFTGAMDWLANVDGIRWFKDEVWPRIARQLPNATMDVVGREPPRELITVAAAERLPWRFTGFVDDVRSYVKDAAVFVIPLRIGGGTRLKAFEAMAMGCPTVSTTIGMEGLDVRAGAEYLNADGAQEFADAVVHLLHDRASSVRLARTARKYVEENCSYTAVAKDFERICQDVIARSRRGPV